jgi:uncharacterized protein (DUF1778 family)
MEWEDSLMTTEAQRTARVEARIAPECLEIIRRAAEAQGRSISDFIVASAEEAAKKAIADITILRLSREAQEQFATLVLQPPTPPLTLMRAFERHRASIED